MAAEKDYEGIADYVVAGEIIMDGVFKELITVPVNKPGIKGKLEAATTNLQRIQIMQKVYSHEDMYRNLNYLTTILKKDDAVAKILRKRGDNYMLDSKSAMRCYNCALVMAPPSGKELGKVLAHRARMFHHFKNEKCFLKDAKLSLHIGISIKEKDKLKDLPHMTYPMKKKFADFSSMEVAKRKYYRDEIMMKLYGPSNKNIPAASEYISIKYTKEKGRYLVTDMDLAASTTVIVEEPYVAMLNKGLSWDTEHCGRCFKKTDCLIPCPNCVFGLYCSQKCLVDDAKEAHKYECACMNLVHGLRYSKAMRMSFRTVCKAGPVELHKRYVASAVEPAAKVAPTPGEKKGFNPTTGNYDNGYYQICHLTTQVEQQDIPTFSIGSLILAKLLKLKTEFFKGYGEPDKSKFITFVASQILAHASSYQLNSFGLTETIDMDVGISGIHINPTYADTEFKDIATAVYPFISLLSHSCCPNAVCENKANGRMSIITNREVKAGEEISITYGYWFWLQPHEVRQTCIQRYYFFKCECVACANHWPLVDDFPKEPEYLCPICTDEFGFLDVAESKACIVVPCKQIKRRGFGICQNCESEVNLAELISEAEKHEQIYERANDLMSNNKPLEAIPLLAACVKFYQRTFCPPYRMYLCAADQLEKAQGMIIRNVVVEVKPPTLEALLAGL